MLNNQPSFLVIGAGHLQVPFIREAQSLGYYVVATDRDPRAPGMFVANEGWLCDTYDASAHCTLIDARRKENALYAFKGVATAGADVAPTVAAVAEHCGLPGIAPAIARRTHNKHEVRKALAADPVTIPYNPDTFIRLPVVALRAMDETAPPPMPYPFVVKPLEDRASRGVTVVRDRSDVTRAAQRAAAYDEVLCESAFASISEHSAEIILDGKGATLYFNMVDRMFRYDDGIPFEIGHVSPSVLYGRQEWFTALVLVKACARALGVTWGPFKCDLVRTDAGFKVLECTARLSGGFDCMLTTPLATGKAPMRTLIQLASGSFAMPCLEPAQPFFVACRALLPPPGRILALPPMLPDPLHHVHPLILAYPGEVIPSYDHCAMRPGFVVTAGFTHEQAWSLAASCAHRWEAGYVIDSV